MATNREHHHMWEVIDQIAVGTPHHFHVQQCPTCRRIQFRDIGDDADMERFNSSQLVDSDVVIKGETPQEEQDIDASRRATLFILGRVVDALYAGVPAFLATFITFQDLLMSFTIGLTSSAVLIIIATVIFIIRGETIYERS